MYLKYTVVSGNRTDVQNEIGDLLTEVITPNDAVYGTAVIDGTGPTAGTYTRTSTATDKHLAFTKKHAQYDAATMPAEVTLKLFGSDSSYSTTSSYIPTLQIGDKLGGNSMGEYFPGNFSDGINGWNAALSGTEHHFIFNDTTFVHQSIAPLVSTSTSQYYAGTIWSDFEITAYDQYAISENPLYYPGCAVIHQAADPNNSNTGSGGSNFFGAWRFQYQKQFDGSFANSGLSTLDHSPTNLMGGDIQRASTAYFSTFPPADQPFWHTWGPSGSSIAMTPLQMDGLGPTFNNPSMGPAYDVGLDARWHNVMLNTYRISTHSGYTGDYMETSDNTRYYMFTGHRTLKNPREIGSWNSVDRQVVYAFPRNNVTMP